jgi:hypothetical protein
MQWKKLSDSGFALYQEGKQMGQMMIDYASAQQTADCSWEDQRFLIRRTGFWKSGVEMEDAGSKKIVVSVHPKKWYSNRLEVAAFGQHLELKVWNNPLAEWVLEREGKPVLAYGLSTDGIVGVRITAAETNVHPYYHFLLWYLFFPVAQENCGDNASFFLLLSQ